ncbi:hypothetical protein GHT06_021577 [Daphnia sinensis]|uniref:THAP-type domain-containing protein n=1 Tax=Daphnia sinensis TaxID=1820382 RepID=A0AAD5PN04_9CRUS|nr:hypothetical protein GHT06_021577 [Daphnia sinensis]
MRCYPCRDTYNSSRDKENGVTLFSVPKNFVKKWKEVIPHLNKSSYFCSLHFDAEEIEKGNEILKVFYPYVRWKLKLSSYPKYVLLMHSDYTQELVRKRTTRESDQATTLVPQKRRVLMDLPICSKQKNIMMPKVAAISKSSPHPTQPPDLVDELAKPPEEAVLVSLPKTFSHQVQAIQHEIISSDPEIVLATADIIENPEPMHGYLLAEEPMLTVFPTTVSVLSQVEEQSD